MAYRPVDHRPGEPPDIERRGWHWADLLPTGGECVGIVAVAVALGCLLYGLTVEYPGFVQRLIGAWLARGL